MNKTKTPLCVNSSYLNTTATTDRKNYSFNKSNKMSTNNHNGSFIEAKSANKNQNLKKITPTLIVSNVEMETKKTQSKVCTCCGINMKSDANDMACNLFDQYDLNSYSPNKKCAKFIETNSFSPNSPKSEALMNTNSNNIHSSAKKSLLAKAISNNALTNEKANNLSMEDLSIMSSNSSLSSCSSITSLTGSPSSTAVNKVVKTKSLSNVNISELDNEDDSILKKSILCDECWTKNKTKTKKADASYVSLIAIDNEDEIETKVENNLKNKRKVRLSTENDMINYNDEHRRSSIMSDSNSEKNKKFKNQVTSTPAAQQFFSTKKANTSRKSNSFYQHNNINNNDGKFIFCFKHNNNNNITIFDLGLYFGNGRHIDGSSIRIFYQRKLIMLNETELSDQNDKMNIDCDQPIRNLICVWISRDPYSDKSILDYSLDQSQVLLNFFKK